MTWFSTRRNASVGKSPLSGIPPANETTAGFDAAALTSVRARSSSAAMIWALGDERSLADVGARPAGGDELLVRLGDRPAVHPERVRELAGRGQLHPRDQQPLADESLELRLDLARQRDRFVPVEREI